MDKFSKYIDRIVNKALSEALEKKAEELVSEVSKKVETNEKLHGKQSKIDVAEPKGKITSADFAKLRKKKDMKEYTMGDDQIEKVEPYGNFSTDSPKKVGKVKNVGYNYEKKVAKEFNEGRYLGQKRDGKDRWFDETNSEYRGDFDFDFDEEEFDNYDNFISSVGDQNWFGERGRMFFDSYRDAFGPMKLRKKRMEEQGETEEGNKFSGARAKAVEQGDSTFEVDGKVYPVKSETKENKHMRGKTKVSESIQLSEEELVDLIERMVIEQKTKNYEKKEPTVAPMQNKIDSRQKEINQDHIIATAEKMNKYLKTGSNEKYEPNPTHFPEGNGELKKMDKKAYVPSDAVEEYIDAFAYPGQTNLVYDEIKPNDEWIEANIKGSSKTGNAEVDEEGNPLGNVVPSKTGEKFYKNYQNNIYGGEQMNASYKRYPQPVDQAGEDVESGDLKTKKGALGSEKIFKALGESIDEKKQKKINEEIEKMKKIVGYNQKTQ
jgi:hypothetical protein